MMNNSFQDSDNANIDISALNKFGTPTITTETQVDKITTVSTWPNGAFIQTITKAGEVDFKTNCEIVKKEDGSYYLNPDILKD